MKKIKIFNIVWRKRNSHNKTYLCNPLPLEHIIVGKETYGPLDVKFSGNKKEKLVIGNYCSIAEGVKFMLGGGHRYDTLSTYPFKVLMFKTTKVEATTKGTIVIEDDVWIGMDALILSGVKIGKGAVIGAGTVVSKDIPPYSIAVGNPARVIKKRFSDDVIAYLMNLDFSKINFPKIKSSILYKKIKTIEDIKEIINSEFY